MFKNLLSNEPVNTGRQKEIDLIKAISIIGMIICHVIEEIYTSYKGDPFAVYIREYGNQIIGAQAFMIAMGIGIAYSRKIDWKLLLERGVNLFFIGMLLNLARYALPNLLAFLYTGDIYYRKTAFLTFSSDIMQFAGVTFLLIGILKYFHFSELKIFLTSILMNIIGMLTVFKINTGSYPLDQFFGLFFSTKSESFFPLFHWFIFPAFGMYFGYLLKYVNDKKKFYLTLLIPTGIITIIYVYVAACVNQSYFRVIQDLNAFNYMNITDALMHLVCNTFLICVCFYIVGLFSEKATKAVNFISGNINRFYCVQWILISFLDTIFSAVFAYEVTKGYEFYLLTLCVFLVTWTVVFIYSTYLAKKCDEFFGKRTVLWYGVILILAIGVCTWAYGAGLPMPNLWNEYLK